MELLFLVVDSATLFGTVEDEEWTPAAPAIVRSIGEAAKEARRLAEANPARIFAVVQLGPIIGSWAAPPPVARPVEQAAEVDAGPIRLVHARHDREAG